MRCWLIILGGLIVWAGHFFALYIAASAFPGQATARWLAVGASVLAIAACAFILRRVTRLPSGDGFERWSRDTAKYAALLAAVAVIWQAAPIVLA